MTGEARPDLVRPEPALPGRIFVTGASGFIGRALTDRARELGAAVSGVDLRPDPGRGVLGGSTTDPGAWAAGLDGVDTVVHTAAIVSNVAPLDRAWEVNVLGTRRTLEAAARAGVRRFVHFSSVAAYGSDFPDGVDETYPVRVDGATYTDTKVNGEAVVLAAHAAGEIDVTVVRPADVYGPGSVWIVTVLEVLRAGHALLPDGGRGIFSPTYVDNLVDGVLLAVATDAAAGQVFNIGDGVGVTCAEYFGRVAAMAGGRVRTLPMRVAAPLADVVGRVERWRGRPSEVSRASMVMLNRSGTFSIDKARRVLGYEPVVDLDEGMRRSEAWARAAGLLT